MSAGGMERADIRRLVAEVVAATVPTLRVEDVRGDRDLRGLGADSVDRVEILTTLQRRLGLDGPLSTFAAVPDVDALAALLHEQVRA